ncbi:down syndrome cell adhesion molecule [Caerostris extrusa]|uniref:Down syndrome cell adhesion molecule n=1 Tax=Caerostris extrusa TaxID=172846 RepID=A0AAV4U4T7_CAEEX|nr:down syndrome cell adhesion molecule [Caerostris extrusa]
MEREYERRWEGRDKKRKEILRHEKFIREKVVHHRFLKTWHLLNPVIDVFLNVPSDKAYIIKDELTSKGKISTLMVSKPDRRDSALFSCTADNAFGKDDTNIQVLVEDVTDCKAAMVDITEFF